MNLQNSDRISDVETRNLSRGDAEGLLAFAKKLPPHDLLFAARDLTHPKVINAWIDDVEEGLIHSEVATYEGEIVGYTALISDALSWSPHVGEIRVLLSPKWRGRGLGRQLVQATFTTALKLNLEKLMASMTTDQHGAIAIFEELGFRGEALLRSHVRLRDGTTQDLAILALDLNEMSIRHAAFGVDQALT